MPRYVFTTKYVYIKSTTVYVPASELGLDWDSPSLPTPLSPARVPLPPESVYNPVFWPIRKK